MREGVRNVVKHADAQHLTVDLGKQAEHVWVRVRDDGRGPGPDPGRSPEGHLGLRLLHDVLQDFGGRMEVSEPPDGGTTLSAHFPRVLVSR